MRDPEREYLEEARRADHLSTENMIVRRELESERNASSNSTFGFVFLVCVILAALIAAGIWAYTSGEFAKTTPNNRNVTVNVKENNPPLPPPPLVIREPSPPPPTIVVPPPPAEKEEPPVKEDPLPPSPLSEKSDE
jgi:hypothetical protein